MKAAKGGHFRQVCGGVPGARVDGVSCARVSKVQEPAGTNIWGGDEFGVSQEPEVPVTSGEDTQRVVRRRAWNGRRRSSACVLMVVGAMEDSEQRRRWPGSGVNRLRLAAEWKVGGHWSGQEDQSGAYLSRPGEF